MSRDDDWLKNGLPTFDGGKDKSLARKMLGRMGGPQGFKTAQQALPDGSVVTVQTKGNMPPQISIVRAVAKEVIRAGLQFHGRILDKIVQLTGGHAKAIISLYDYIPHTDYFKDDTPHTVMPDEIPEPGQTMADDVVLFGTDKRWSPVSTQEVQRDNWIYAAPSGKRWQLAVDVNPNISFTTVNVRLRAEWVFGGSTTSGRGTVIATITVPFSATIFKDKACGWDGAPSAPEDNTRAAQWGVFGATLGSPSAVQHSPNGSCAMVHRIDAVCNYYLWPNLNPNSWIDCTEESGYKRRNLDRCVCVSQVFRVDVSEPVPGSSPTASITLYKNQSDCYSKTYTAAVWSDASIETTVSLNHRGPNDFTTTKTTTAYTMPEGEHGPDFAVPPDDLIETALYAVVFDTRGNIHEITGTHSRIHSRVNTATGQITSVLNSINVDSGYAERVDSYGNPAGHYMVALMDQHSCGEITHTAKRTYKDTTTIMYDDTVCWKGFVDFEITVEHRSTGTVHDEYGFLDSDFTQALTNPSPPYIWAGSVKNIVTTTYGAHGENTTTPSYSYSSSFVNQYIQASYDITALNHDKVWDVDNPYYVRDVFTRLHWLSNNCLQASHQMYIYRWYSYPDQVSAPNYNIMNTPYWRGLPIPVVITPNGYNQLAYEGPLKEYISWNPRSNIVIRGTRFDGWV